VTERASSGGYLSDRPGRLAAQIGPCCGSAEAATVLLRHALFAFRGRPVMVDAPITRADLTKIVRQAGLTKQRTLLRMCRGAPVLEDPEWYQLSSGPELG
jgi:hypothetical protein